MGEGGNLTARLPRRGRAGPTATPRNAVGRMSEFLNNGILQASYKYDAMG